MKTTNINPMSINFTIESANSFSSTAILAEAAIIASQMSQRIQIIDELTNQIRRFLSVSPADWSPEVNETMSNVEQTMVEAYRCLKKYHTMIA